MKESSEMSNRWALIRGAEGTHHYRAGEWARIVNVVVSSTENGRDRCCYAIEFLDGETDLWPIEESGYEFNPTIKDGR